MAKAKTNRIKLTQSFIKAIKPPTDGKRYYITDSVVSGLRLYVGSSGKMTWLLSYRSADGRLQTHKIGEAGDMCTVTQARGMATAVKADLIKGEEPKKKKVRDDITLAAFLDIYEQKRAVDHKNAGRSMQKLRSAFADFLGKPLNTLHVLDIETWRRNKRNDKTKIKAATCNRCTVALKAALNWGVEMGFLKSNPLQALKRLKLDDAESRVERYLSEEERTRLYRALDAHEERIRRERTNHNQWLEDRHKPPMPPLSSGFADHLKPMIIISLNTGMRRGNLFSLVWGDIDFTARQITLRAEHSKSSKRNDIPMMDIVVDTLEQWRKQAADKSPDALVFPSPKTGQKFDNVNKAWASVLKDAQIDNFRWHDMRHDFASQLVMRGVDLNTVRELLGHSDIKMTLRYAHLAPESKLRAVRLLDQLSALPHAQPDQTDGVQAEQEGMQTRKGDND